MKAVANGRASRKFLAAITVSAFGDWLTTLALMVVFAARVGAAGTALYMACRVIPRPLGSWLGGRASDRLGAGRVCRTGALAAAAASLLLALGVYGTPVLWLCALVVLGQIAGASLLTGLFAAVTVIAPEEGRQKLLGAANATTYAAMIAGPLVAMPLFLLYGPGTVLAVDALSFLAIFAALRIREAPGARHGSAGIGSLRMAAHLWRLPLGRLLLSGRLATFALVTMVQIALLNLALKTTGSAATIGLLYAAMGCGAVCGSVLARNLKLGAPGITAVLLLEAVAYVLANALDAAWLVVCVLFAAAFMGPLHQVTGAKVISDAAGDAAQGAGMATFTAAGQVGLILGSIAGLLVPGWPGVLGAGVGTAAIICLAAASVPRRVEGPYFRSGNIAAATKG